MHILNYNFPVEYYEAFCEEGQFHISVSSKHKSGICQMTDFIKKLINNFKSTNTLSYGNSTIQSSIKEQIADSYIPYKHESSRYLVNNYTADTTLQDQQDKVSEFERNFKDYVYIGPSLLKDKNIMNIFMVAAEHLHFFDYLKKTTGQYKKFRYGIHKKVNRSLRKRFHKQFMNFLH